MSTTSVLFTLVLAVRCAVDLMHGRSPVDDQMILVLVAMAMAYRGLLVVSTVDLHTRLKTVQDKLFSRDAKS